MEWINDVHPVFRDTNEKVASWDFPGGPVVKNLPANAGDMGLIPYAGGN